MRKGHKKNISLPNINDKDKSYITQSIQMFKKGCHDSEKGITIDGAYGDYNMHLFRFKNRKNFVRNIPSAFTSNIKNLLTAKGKNPQQQKIAQEHNNNVKQILKRPKEIYIENIRKTQEEQMKEPEAVKKTYQFIKGYDEEVREHQGHLSFQYLNSYQSNNWFKIKDFSDSYVPPRLPSPPVNNRSVPKPKVRKRKGHIFFSDSNRSRLVRI